MKGLTISWDFIVIRSKCVTLHEANAAMYNCSGVTDIPIRTGRVCALPEYQNNHRNSQFILVKTYMKSCGNKFMRIGTKIIRYHSTFKFGWISKCENTSVT